MYDMEPADTWKGKIAVLFILWPFFMIIYWMEFNPSKASTLEWFLGVVFILLSGFWGYGVYRYFRR